MIRSYGAVQTAPYFLPIASGGHLSISLKPFLRDLFRYSFPVFIQNSWFVSWHGFAGDLRVLSEERKRLKYIYFRGVKKLPKFFVVF